MSALDWLYQIVVEGLKYIILGHWFFGFSFSQKKTKFWLLAYFLLIPVVEVLNNPYTTFCCYYAWGLLLLLAIFDGKVVSKVKAFLVMWFLIAMVDAVIMVEFLSFIEPTVSESYIKKIIGVVGGAVWGVLAWKGKKLQSYAKKWWRQITSIEYAIVIVSFVAIAIVLGGIQSYLYQTMNTSIRKAVFVFGVIAIVIFLIALVLLFYTTQTKKQLEEMNQLNTQYFNLQKRYYEDSLEQYEDMRRFRHDINNHIFMLSQLCEKNRVDELKKYIFEMSQNYESMCSIHTGNFVADCMISRTVQELEKDKNFTFELDGHFPRKLMMEDIDLCILLSNLLDNAREALEKVEGKKYLWIEVKQYKNHYYLIVRNTVQEVSVNFNRTSKEDSMHHGYGIQNVRKIVEKYHGEITWRCQENVVEVKMSIVSKE